MHRLVKRTILSLDLRIAALPSGVNTSPHASWRVSMVYIIAASFPIVRAPSVYLASGQLFPEGLLQDLLEPRRDRATE